MGILGKLLGFTLIPANPHKSVHQFSSHQIDSVGGHDLIIMKYTTKPSYCKESCNKCPFNRMKHLLALKRIGKCNIGEELIICQFFPLQKNLCTLFYCTASSTGSECLIYSYSYTHNNHCVNGMYLAK